jgi:hypothetical protein
MRPPEPPPWDPDLASRPDPALTALYQRALAPLAPDADRLYRARARLAQAAGGPTSGAGLLQRGLWTIGVIAIAGAGTAAWLGTRTAARPLPAPGHDIDIVVETTITPAASAVTAPAARALPPAANPPGIAPAGVARPHRALATTSRRGSHAAERPLAANAVAPRTLARNGDDPLPTTDGTAIDPTTSEGSSPLADESRRLGQVYAQLRRQRNADAALEEIAAYMRAHPDGVLMNEARLAQIDAFLLKGQNDDALAALAQVQLGSRPREQELRLIRGELRARTDCRAALVDFSAVLAIPAGDALHERALRGRAGCELRQGDQAAARVDLTEYLRRFPDSQHAPRARAQLEAAPRP